jgi:hypothetical protein
LFVADPASMMAMAWGFGSSVALTTGGAFCDVTAGTEAIATGADPLAMAVLVAGVLAEFAERQPT